MAYSSIIKKKKICVTCGNKDYIFSKGECVGCANQRSYARRVEANEDEIETESRINLVEDLDAITSLVVRHSAANSDGLINCYTCDKKITIAEAQCSHFIPRANMGTRFLFDNLRAACKECNEYKSGNLVEYEKRLEQEKNGIVSELRELAREVSKPTISDLKELLAQYRYKFTLIRKR